MKLAIITALVALFAFDALAADQSVRGYTRKDGTYVQPYTRSAPNNSYNDNYGVRGNTNPYTGQQGTGSPTFNDRTPEYNQRTLGSPGYVAPSSPNRQSGYGR